MRRAVFSAVAVSLLLHVFVDAQHLTSGKNVNVVGGPATLDPNGIPVLGDPYLSQQNEPSMACSSRNPLTCVAGGNDYRRLDNPGVRDGKVTGDAWLGLYWTRDGGSTWRSSLLPGFAEDATGIGQSSPAHPYGAAADPTVRAGTNGIFYYSGIAFNRSAITSNTSGTEGKDGVMFVGVFIDDNNTQQVNTPPRYVGAWPVAYSNGARFLDKPTLTVDIPRQGSATCTIPAAGDVAEQTFPGGNVYVAYSAFMGPDDNVHTKLMFHRSTDCGRTWGNGIKLSESHKINQSAAISIHPATGQIFVAWREFSSTNNADQIVVAVSNNLGQSFEKGTVVSTLNGTSGSSAFDQPSLPNALEPNFRMFRTNSYPTMCVASNGQAYLSWAQRGLGPLGETRVVYTRSTGDVGAPWTTPEVIEPYSGKGHQFMPAITCSGDKVTLIWYDQREDAIAGIVPDASAFGPFIADQRPLQIPTRTLDVRAVQAAAGAAFGASTKVSRYALGVYEENGLPATIQLQYYLENLPLFAGGVVPFIGDYIDVAPATMFQPQASGLGQAGTTSTGQTFKNKRRQAAAAAVEPNGWVFNTTAAGTSVHHAIWTDNRDVVAGEVDFENPACNPGTQGGTKNQNLYTARLTNGLVVGVFANSRPLADRKRAFSVFVQNMTAQPKTVELRIANQPTGGTASFLQFPVAGIGDPQTGLLDVLEGERAIQLAGFSGAARTVFVSGASMAPIRVDVDEILPNGTVGQQLFAVINPDGTNPAPADADLRGTTFNETHLSTVSAPTVTVTEGLSDPLNPNFLNPTFLNPTFLNPNFLNPNFLNPTFLNPTFLNPNFLNPNFLNPTFLNPNFLNPTFLNPNFLNPNFLNPTFLNTTPTATLTEMEWDVSAEGNAASSYLVTLLSSTNIPPEWRTQLVIYRTYLAPAGLGRDAAGNIICVGADGSKLGTSVQHDLLADILNPTFLNPTFLNTVDYSNPTFLNAALSGELENATFALSSADNATIKLSVLHDGSFQPSFITPLVIPEAVDTNQAAAGVTRPTLGPLPLAIATPSVLPEAVVGTEYQQQLTGVGGVGPYTWQYFPGPEIDFNPDVLPPAQPCNSLPPGMTFDPETAEIGGATTAAGTCIIQIRLTDSSVPAQSVDGFLVLGVNEPLVMTTDGLPAVQRGIAYTFALQATGGKGARTWSLQSGTLPAGLTLTPAGVLQGTTTAVGTYSIVVAVTDSSAPFQSSIRAFTVNVTDPSLFVTILDAPTQVTAGRLFLTPVEILVIDSNKNPVPGAEVTLSLLPNASNAELVGVVTALTDEAGRALVQEVSINQGGWALRLRALAAVPGASGEATHFLSSVGFAPTGSLTSPRAGHTSTLLGNGTVLIAGGFIVNPTGSDVYYDTAEIFNPVTGTFSLLSSTTAVGRELHTATLLMDGRVLIVGGFRQTGSGGEPIRDVEIYNPATQTFSSGPALATGRFYHTATLLPDGKVAVIAGMGGQILEDDVLSSTEVFDPSANGGAGAWTAGPSLTVGRSGHSATLLPTATVLIAGGETVADSGATTSAEQWTQSAAPAVLASPMNVARAHHTATLLPNGRVVLTGGIGSAADTNTVEIFDSTTLRFALDTPLSVTPFFHTATWLQVGEILTAGGLDRGSRTEPPTVIAQAHLGVPFAATDGMEHPRYGHAATRLRDGRVLMTGGVTALTPTPDGLTSTYVSEAELFYPMQTGGFVDGSAQKADESGHVHVGHTEDQLVAQTITASLPGWLSLIDMPAGCIAEGTPPMMTIEIRNATDAGPGDTVLRTENLASPVGYTFGQLNTVAFSQPLHVVPGMRYAIVARAATTSTCYWTNSGLGDKYPGGSGYAKRASESTWFASPTEANDQAFQVVIR